MYTIIRSPATITGNGSTIYEMRLIGSQINCQMCDILQITSAGQSHKRRTELVRKGFVGTKASVTTAIKNFRSKLTGCNPVDVDAGAGILVCHVLGQTDQRVLRGGINGAAAITLDTAVEEVVMMEPMFCSHASAVRSAAFLALAKVKSCGGVNVV